MSLAEKLYRIGECVSDDELRELIRQEQAINDIVPVVFINFYFKNEQLEYELLDSTNGINTTNFFFTKAIGGRGEGFYYLYPNLIFENKKDKKGKLESDKKLKQLENTLRNYLDKKYANDENKTIIESILNILKTEKLSSTIMEEKKEYLFAFLFEKQPFFKAFPEILYNFLENPVSEFIFPKKGFDALSNAKTEVGFNPDVKVFTMDNYHDNYKRRIVDTLQLSENSAKYINRGWLYAIKYLLFYYKGLSYLVIPNFIKQDLTNYQKILNAFKTANLESNIKRYEARENIKRLDDSISHIAKEETNILKMIEKSAKKQNIKKKSKTLFDEPVVNEDELNTIKLQKENLQKEKEQLELLIKDDLLDELEETIKKDELREFLNAISLDLLFVSYDPKYGTMTNIYGTIQDVLPSKISNVKEKMRIYNIVDGIKMKNKDSAKTYLQDYFARFELQAKFSKTLNEKNVQNAIFKERIFLAKLLLSDEQIDYENLLNRFEDNREYDYDGKKRIDDKGIKDWLKNPEQYLTRDQQVIGFLKSIDSLKGDKYGG